MSSEIFTSDASFDPWWWEAAPRPAGREGALPDRADVVVVGAGFTGLSAALVLARAGRSVLVLDAEAVGFGASSRNGGMIGSGHRVGFAELERRYGTAMAEAILREGLASLDFATGLIEREGIDCNFVRCGRFRGAWLPEHYEAFGREIDFMRRKVGLEAELVPKAEQHREVGTERYHGGVIFLSHGGLHPGRFQLGLLDRAEAAGATVAGHTPVTAIARESQGFTVSTSRGRVAARDVIIATNGYTGAVRGAIESGLRRRLIPIPSFLVATEPLGKARVKELIPGGRMIVETRSRHCYYRASPDGERIIFGGRAAMTPTDPRRSGARLRAILVDLYPSLAEVKISHSWSGFVAFSRDHLPHLGVREGVHYALGYSGSGVAMAPYLGWKIAHRLLGKPEGDSPFEKTAFSAQPFHWGLPIGLRFMEGWLRFQDRREGSP